MKDVARNIGMTIFGILVTAIVGVFIYNAEQTPYPDDDWMTLSILGVISLVIVGIYVLKTTSDARKDDLDRRFKTEQDSRTLNHNGTMHAIKELGNEMRESNKSFAHALNIVIKCDVASSRTSLIHLGNKYLKERRCDKHPKGWATINEQQTWLANYENYEALMDLDGTDNGYLEDMYNRIVDIDIANE